MSLWCCYSQQPDNLSQNVLLEHYKTCTERNWSKWSQQLDYTPKNQLQFPDNEWAALVRPKQTFRLIWNVFKKLLQILFHRVSTDWLTNCIRVATDTMFYCSTFLQPAGIPQYIQCIPDGLAAYRFCISYLRTSLRLDLYTYAVKSNK